MNFLSTAKVFLKASGKALGQSASKTANAVSKGAVFAASSTKNFVSVTDELTHGVVKAVSKEGVTQGAAKAVLNKGSVKSASKMISAEEFATRRTGLVELLGKSGKVEAENADAILYSVKPENIEVFERIVKNAEVNPNRLQHVHQLISAENEDAVLSLIKDESIDLSKFKLIDVPEWVNKKNVKLLKKISTVKDFNSQDMRYFVQSVKEPEDVEAVYKLVSHEGVTVEKNGLAFVSDIFYRTDKYGENIKDVRKLISEVTKHKEFKCTSLEDFSDVLKKVNSDNLNLAEKLCLQEKNIPTSTVESMLESYNPESEAFMKELLELLPEDYPIRVSVRDYKVATKYIKFIKSLKITSKSDIIAALESIQHITNETELNAVMKLMKENKNNIKQIADRIIVKNTCLRNADELADVLEQSGRELTPSEIKEVSVYYGCIKKDETRKVVNRLLSEPKNELQGIVRIQDDLLRNQSKAFNDTKKSKFLNELLDKDLAWKDVENVYHSVDSEEKIEFVKKFIDNPKFAKSNIRFLNPKNEADVRRMLDSDVFKPEKYDKYIAAINNGTDVSASIKELRWKQLETLLRKYPYNEDGCILLASVTTNKNKKLISILLRRNFDLDEIYRAVNPYYASSRLMPGLSNQEIHFLTNLYADPEISNNGLRLIMNTEPIDLYKVMQKYPAQTKKALNAGIDVINLDKLIENKHFEKILEQVKNIEISHNIKLEYPLSAPAGLLGNSNDLFITLKSADGTLLKFNKTSGKLMTISKEKVCLNVRNGVKSSTSLYQAKRANGLFGDVISPYYMETYLEKPGQAPLRTIYKESAVPGQYEIYSQAPNGGRKAIGVVKSFPSGKKYVQRTLTSLDGHKSSYEFKSDAAGNRLLVSEIADKDGKIISQTTRSFKRLSDNHFISTVNGKSYDIEYFSDKVIATKLDEAGKKTAETVEYAIVDIPESTAQMMFKEFEAEAKVLEDNMKRSGIKHLVNEEEMMTKLWQKVFSRHGISPYSIDRNALGIMKQMPGDEYFAMKKSCQYVVGNHIEANNACFAGNPIFVSKELANNYGVFSHELGHAKFQALDLANDPELMKIYNAEKRQFTQMYPEANIESIDYFLKGNASAKRGVNEGAAETNLIDQIPQTCEAMQDRTILWEQYFQKTRAYILNKYRKLV